MYACVRVCVLRYLSHSFSCWRSTSSSLGSAAHSTPARYTLCIHNALTRALLTPLSAAHASRAIASCCVAPCQGVVSEPTPSPAVKQRTPRTARSNEAALGKPARRRAAARRSGQWAEGEEEEAAAEAAPASDEQRVDEYDEQEAEAEAELGGGGSVRGRAARGTIERKRSSLVASSAGRQHGRRAEEVYEAELEQRQDELEEQAVARQRTRQAPRRGVGAAGSRSGGVSAGGSDARSGKASRQSTDARYAEDEE